MATRFPNSYAFFSGLDAGQAYNNTRDENARKEAAAEDARKKAMQDLLMSQAAEERATTLFSSQESARRLAETQAAAGLGALTTELPVLQAERALTNRGRVAATERGALNFDQTQAGLATTEGLKIKARDLINTQIAQDQKIMAEFPNMTDPNMRKRLADLRALGVTPDRLAEIAPDMAPFLTSTPAAQTVATLPAPAAAVTKSYEADRAQAASVLKQDTTQENALAQINARGDVAATAAEIAAKARVDAAAAKNAGAGSSAAGKALLSLTPTTAAAAPAATKTAVPTAAAPATAPTKATATPAPAPDITAVEAAGQQLDAARLALKQLQDSPRPGLAAGAKAMQAYSDRLREAQRAVSVSELTYQQLLPPQLATFRATR